MTDDTFCASNSPVFSSSFEDHLLEREKNFKRVVSNYMCCGMSNEELEEELEGIVPLSLLKQVTISQFPEQVLLEEFCESEHVFFRHEIYDKDGITDYYPEHKSDTFGMPKTEIHFKNRKKYLTFVVPHEGFCSNRVFERYQEAIKISGNIIYMLNSKITDYNENIYNFIEDEKIKYKKGLQNAGPFIEEINKKISQLKEIKNGSIT